MAISKIYQFRVKISIKILPIFSQFLRFEMLKFSNCYNFVTLTNQFCCTFEPFLTQFEMRKF